MAGIQKVLVLQIVVSVLAGLTFFGIYLTTGNWNLTNAAYALIALMALEKRIRGNDPVDERDKEIIGRASLIAYNIFWACFILACVTVSMAASPSISIPAASLTFIPMAGYFLLTVARSITGLVLYARGA